MRDIRYDFIRFTATLMILLHHFNTTCNEKCIPLYRVLKELIGRCQMGAVGVGVFFILSGALLHRTNKDNFSIALFYKKRVIRILIPYWISFACALPITYITYPNIVMDILRCKGAGQLISIMGLGYCSGFWDQFGIKCIWLVGEWFTAVIIILYIIYPVLRWLFNKYRTIGSALIVFIFICNLKMEIFTYHGGFFSITNGLMYFWLGMIFEEYKSHLNIIVDIIALITMVLVFIINPRSIIGINYLPAFLLSLSAFVFLYELGFNGRFIRYICKHSYEIYLIHHRIFLILMPLLLSSISSNSQALICFFALTGLIFLLAEKLNQITKFSLKVVGC